ncbi:DNA-directed RNA polymerase iii subunit, partial [Globisporangium splendens]
MRRALIIQFLRRSSRQEELSEDAHHVMALKSRAEMQLLQVLNQHKAKSASFYLKEQQQKAQQDDVDKQHFTATHSLAQYRKPNRKHESSVREEDDEMVAQLQDDFYVVGGGAQNQGETNEQPTNEIIALNAIARREKRMAAQQQYTEHVKQVSEDIQVAIIQAADLVKEALSNSDSRLRAAVQTLADEKLLLRSTHEDILITQFAQTLDTIERTRTSRVRDELQTLTAVLMDTAHALPPEGERIIEAEAYELNVVVISNRNVYADLIARMATADVDVSVATRLAWENGQRRWRQTRHHDAIRRFQDTMNSALFTDPDERLGIVREIRMFQEHVHMEKRLAALMRLEAAGAQLTSDTVNEVLAMIRATQIDEEEQNHAFFARLMAVHVDKASEAQLLREHLRLETHGFGALAQEGDIARARDHLAAMLNTDTLEEFFRMAGGLRGELDSIVKRLCTAGLIYEANLQPLTTSLQVLLSALPLEGAMEAQGKGAERKALQATLEKR